MGQSSRMIIAASDRLQLRHFVESDLDAMHAVFGDPDVMRFGPGAQTREWIAQWLARQIEEYDRRGCGLWAVDVRGNPIGYCGLTWFPDINGQPEVEIGYRLARASWGQGYATEAARLARDHAFDALGLRRVIALVDPGNKASIRVAEKLGMRHEADVMLDGYDHADRVYSVERDERERADRIGSGSRAVPCRGWPGSRRSRKRLADEHGLGARSRRE